MAKHGQGNHSYGLGGALEVLSELLDNIAQAAPQSKPKPAPKPDDKKQSSHSGTNVLR